MNNTQPPASNPFIRLRPETREKYEAAKRIKGTPFVVLADRAIDALFQSDPELRDAKLAKVA